MFFSLLLIVFFRKNFHPQFEINVFFGIPEYTKWAAVCAMRRAPHEGQNPRRLQDGSVRNGLGPRSDPQGEIQGSISSKGNEFLMGAIGTTQAQKAVRLNTTFQKGIELFLDKIGQSGSGFCLDLRKKCLDMFLHH